MSIRTTDEVIEEKRLERNAKDLQDIKHNTDAIRKQLDDRSQPDGPDWAVRFREGTIEKRRKRGVKNPEKTKPQDIIAAILLLAGGFLIVFSGGNFIVAFSLMIAGVIITRL